MCLRSSALLNHCWVQSEALLLLKEVGSTGEANEEKHTHLYMCTYLYVHIHTYTWSLIFLGKRQKSTNYLYITTSCNALQAPCSNKPHKDINSQFRQFLSFNIFQKGFEISTFNVRGDRQHFIATLLFIRSSLLWLWVTILVPFHYKGAYCYQTTYCGNSFCLFGDLSDLLRKALRYEQHALCCSFMFSSC